MCEVIGPDICLERQLKLGDHFLVDPNFESYIRNWWVSIEPTLFFNNPVFRYPFRVFITDKLFDSLDSFKDMHQT